MIAEQQRRAQAQGQGAPQSPDVVRQQQANEQAAFDRHAAQQRQVFTQRMQHRMVRPAASGRPTNPGNGQGNPNGDHGKGKDKGGH
jgi:hypothetical protein